MFFFSVDNKKLEDIGKQIKLKCRDLRTACGHIIAIILTNLTFFLSK